MSRTPARMPAEKSPRRNSGRMAFSMMRLDMASVITGSSPRPDLDAHLALVGRHDEQDAVVLALLADAPFAAEPVAEVLDRVALQRLDRDDGELIGRLLLERGELGLDRRVVVGAQQAGLVGDAAGEGREVRLGCAATAATAATRHASATSNAAAARGAQLKGEAHRAAGIVRLL